MGGGFAADFGFIVKSARKTAKFRLFINKLLFTFSFLSVIIGLAVKSMQKIYNFYGGNTNGRKKETFY